LERNTGAERVRHGRGYIQARLERSTGAERARHGRGYRAPGRASCSDNRAKKQGQKKYFDFCKLFLALLKYLGNLKTVLGGTAGRRNFRCGGLQFF
jgi:hypothetical protein